MGKTARENELAAKDRKEMTELHSPPSDHCVLCVLSRPYRRDVLPGIRVATSARNRPPKCAWTAIPLGGLPPRAAWRFDTAGNGNDACPWYCRRPQRPTGVRAPAIRQAKEPACQPPGGRESSTRPRRRSGWTHRALRRRWPRSEFRLRRSCRRWWPGCRSRRRNCPVATCRWQWSCRLDDCLPRRGAIKARPLRQRGAG